MQLPPLSVLLQWPAPNYTNPELRGHMNVIVIGIFFPLALLIVGIRIHTRVHLSRSFGTDDWFIIATLFPTTAFAVLSLLVELYYKWNRHIWDVQFESLDTIVVGLKIVLACEILFCLATSLTKISMLTLTYRILGKSSSILSKIIVGTIVLIATQGTVFIFTVLFECGAPSTYWTLSLAPQPQCISEATIILSAGVVNVVTDLVVVLLPIPTVWRVKLPFQQQMVIVLLFAVGFLITLVGAVRTYYLYKVNQSWDKTWGAFPCWITSSIELYLGVICASIPATKKFFSQFGPRWLGASMVSDAQNAPRRSLRLSRGRLYPRNESQVGVILCDDKQTAQVHSQRESESFEAELTDLTRPRSAYLRGSEYAVHSVNSRTSLVQK